MIAAGAFFFFGDWAVASANDVLGIGLLLIGVLVFRVVRGLVQRSAER
jgi:hypothetical protein